jgi:hypothetical protein
MQFMAYPISGCIPDKEEDLTRTGSIATAKLSATQE